MAATNKCLAQSNKSGTGSGAQNMHLGMGPAHPAMHGIIRIVTEMDGEIIKKADVEIGYLHRAFEKDCEVGPYNNAIPYTDRGDDNRKLCSLYLSILRRMGVRAERFGDATAELADL